ncbi:MAG: hypothetical protein SOI56_01805 [Eubacteriales bacterium]|jgi:hypothetical protein
MLIMTERENELLDKIEPYMSGSDGNTLRDNAPDDVKAAYKELMEFCSLMDGVQ